TYTSSCLSRLPRICMSLLCASLFLLEPYRHHRDLHSFPTRRSSDLPSTPRAALAHGALSISARPHRRSARQALRGACANLFGQRSEEHTSELQSPCNLVCRLLLEKKKNNMHDDQVIIFPFDVVTRTM